MIWRLIEDDTHPLGTIQTRTVLRETIHNIYEQTVMVLWSNWHSNMLEWSLLPTRIKCIEKTIVLYKEKNKEIIII